MASVSHYTPDIGAASSMVPRVGTPTAAPGSGVEPAVNAGDLNLDEYLNQPIRDLLQRFGAPPAPQARPDNDAEDRSAADPTPAADASPSPPIDPTTFIQPVIQALSTLGSGQFGNLDPTSMLSGISTTLENAGQSVQRALSGLDGGWAGEAAEAAAGKTISTLARGSNLSRSTAELQSSLATVVASVQHAQVRLVEAIDEFLATLAAIGPNIIFPWGLAAAVAAANRAITTSVEVITETQSELAVEAGRTTTAGESASEVASAGGSGARVTGVAGSASSALAPAGFMQSLGPVLQMGTGMMSPVMSGVQSAVAASKNTHNGAVDEAKEEDKAHGRLGAGPHGGGLGAGGGAAGVATTPAPALRQPQPNTTSGGDVVQSTPSLGRFPSSSGLGGAPMMGAPLGQAAKSSAGSGHNAATFLHTTDQGGEIVGDLGQAGLPVLGEATNQHRTDLQLHI